MSVPSPDAARRRYVLITALTWLPQGLGLATGVLLMSARGLGLPAIGLFFVVHSVLVAGLELPTGGLADVLGRRGVLVTAAMVGTLALAWMAFATTTREFVVIAALRGVSRALSSGPAEAWYVDAVHAADPGASIRSGLARGAAAGSIGLGAGALIGGGLPLVVPWSDGAWLVPLAVPMALAALAFAALLLVTLTMLTEPPRTSAPPRLREVVRGVPATVVDGIKLGVSDRSLALLFGTVVANGFALSSVELLTPGRFAELTGGATTAGLGYALVATAGFVASGLGSSLSPLLTGGLGSPKRTAVAAIVVSAGSLASLVVTGDLTGASGIIAVGGGYVGMFLGLGLLGPARSEIMHARVGASVRATMVSVQSLTLQGGGVVGTLVVAQIAEAWSIPAAWLVAGAVFLASTALLLGVRHGPRSGLGLAGGTPEQVSRR